MSAMSFSIQTIRSLFTPLLLTMTKNYDYCSELMIIMRRFMSCKCKPTHPSLSGGKSMNTLKQTNTDHRRILFIIQFIFTNLPMFKSID